MDQEEDYGDDAAEGEVDPETWSIGKWCEEGRDEESLTPSPTDVFGKCAS